MLMKYLFLSFLLLSCSSNMQNQTETDTIQLNVGQITEYVLEGNPTTGFSWHYEIGDTSLMKITEHIEPIQTENKQMVGVGSIYTYKIEGLKKGETSLTFTYKRVWEKDIPPAKQEKIKVSIN